MPREKNFGPEVHPDRSGNVMVSPGNIKIQLSQMHGKFVIGVSSEIPLVRDRDKTRKLDQRNCSSFVFEIVGGDVASNN